MNPGRKLRGWLLWLALLLPIAQSFADVHALSHLDDGRDHSLVHLAHCDLCLAAAALSSGAPAAAAAAALPGPAGHAAPGCPAGIAPRRVDTGLPPARAPPASA